jgi:hypothetical protein
MAYVEVYVDEQDILESLGDDELYTEMERRKLKPNETDIEHVVTAIWLKRRVGLDYQKELDELIYATIGKIV